MEVLEAIKTRRSIRKYQRRRIGKRKLMRVLEAARLSPSAGNRQPWFFVVVTNRRIRERLRAAYGREWFVSAPVIVAVGVFPSKAWVRKDGEKFWQADGSIAMQTLVLAAWSEGLGTCWIGAFDERKAKRILRLPRNSRIVAMTPLGYPAEKKGPVKDRKPLKELVHFEHW